MHQPVMCDELTLLLIHPDIRQKGCMNAENNELWAADLLGARYTGTQANKMGLYALKLFLRLNLALSVLQFPSKLILSLNLTLFASVSSDMCAVGTEA